MILAVLGVNTQDSASGDFSLLAPQALFIDDTGLAGHLRATFSGNLFNLLNSEGLALIDFDGEVTPGILWRCRLDPQ